MATRSEDERLEFFDVLSIVLARVTNGVPWLAIRSTSGLNK